MAIVTPDLVVDSLVWLIRGARRLKLRGLVRRVRSRACWGILSPLQQDVLYQARELGLAYQNWETRREEAVRLPIALCTSANKLMSDLLELEEVELHCCLKAFVRAEDSADDQVETWARSRPFDGRPTDIGPDDRHLVRANSVWAALLGRSDGETHWSPLPCFSSNDLLRHGHLFACSRREWSKFYRSTLVFPLKVIPSDRHIKEEVLGFLAFDSPRRNAFGPMPDALELRDDPTDYYKLLGRQSAYQLGATIAQVISLALKPAYDNHRLEEVVE